jgi:MFS transporter, UMF1 family
METPTTQVKLNDPKVINAWALFDWANSAFALVITVAVFPAYYMAVTDDYVSILGLEVSNSSLYAFAISTAYLVIAVLSPILSGIADYGGKKKFFLKFFTILGSTACLSLFFFKGMDQIALGTVSFILAMIGFAGGLVFYNSYLPEIVTEDRYDRVSARGFAFGYIGSVLLLISNLVMIKNPEWFGIGRDSLAPRISFVMVGLWWIGFATIPFRILPKDPPNRPQSDLLKKGFRELKKVWKAVQHQPNTKTFLISFFCYSAGVQTVLYLAATFAEKELMFDTGELIIVVLLLQIVAVGGAYLFARVSEWKGNKLSLITMLIIWTTICFAAYFVYSKAQFYIVAAGVGMVMGGIQSLSRSTYSKLLPEKTKDTTSYFSFYDVLEKVAIILGTFMFGFFDYLTGSMRVSVLVLGVFFIISMIILSRIKIQAAKVSEQNFEVI